MAIIKPFCAIRPKTELCSRVAALPYDVYNRTEAKEAVKKEPLSFLAIDRPETQFPDDFDMYASCVYEKAKELYENRKADGTFLKDSAECFYLYELTRNHKAQTGIVCCTAVDDYLNNVILRHESTREEKERDRIRHVTALNAQTGPIFMAYKNNKALSDFIVEKKTSPCLYDFTSEDGITHRVWRIADVMSISFIMNKFLTIPHLYIADGHHRAASAVKASLLRRKEGKESSHDQPYDFFLSVVFPEDELTILPYYRVVKDLNGRSSEEFLNLLQDDFYVVPSMNAVSPEKKGVFGLRLKEGWYQITAKDKILNETDPVKSLDVSVLQKYVFEKLLGITDPRTNERLNFIGGIHGVDAISKRVESDCMAGFSLYPTSMKELMAVAENNLLMPPKSTWFEPKLRSGIFIHEI